MICCIILNSSHNKGFRREAFLMNLKAYSSIQQGVFSLSLVSSNFNDQFEPNPSQVGYFLHMLGYTKYRYWSLTIPKVYPAFRTY